MAEEIKMKRGHYNESICKVCGGACCQRYAGIYVPKDFNEQITPEFVCGLLNTGKYAIDWWEGDPTVDGTRSATYFIRPRHVNEPAIKGSFGGVCVNWSKENGCSLAKNERPFQCRLLKPAMDFECEMEDSDKATKQDCAIAWYALQDVLEQARDLFYSEP